MFKELLIILCNSGHKQKNIKHQQICIIYSITKQEPYIRIEGIMLSDMLKKEISVKIGIWHQAAVEIPPEWIVDLIIMKAELTILT